MHALIMKKESAHQPRRTRDDIAFSDIQNAAAAQLAPPRSAVRRSETEIHHRQVVAHLAGLVAVDAEGGEQGVVAPALEGAVVE